MPFKQGHALLIGVGTHRHAAELDEPATVRDAQAVAAALQDEDLCGYPPEQVRIIQEQGADKAGILAALDELAGRAGVDDTVFLFYCGHGALGTDGNYYLVSHDAGLEDERVVEGSGVSEGELLAKLHEIKAERLLLVFNACFSGKLAPTLGPEQRRLKGRMLSGAAAQAVLGTGSGRILITACRDNQASYVGEGELTIFTQALVDGLNGQGLVNNRGGYISAYNLYEHIFEQVRREISDRYHDTQEPVLNVVQGVGPFAVALYCGARPRAGFDPRQELPRGEVQQVSIAKANLAFQQRVSILNTGMIEDITIVAPSGINVQNVSGPVAMPGSTLVIGGQDDIAKKKPEQARKRYLERLRRFCQALPLAAMGGEEDASEEVTLDSVYIDLDTTTPVAVERGEKDVKKGELPVRDREQTRPLPALEAVQKYRRLILLGGPGAGKSTFVHKILAWLAAANLGEVKPPEKIEPDLLPILVVLRELSLTLEKVNWQDLPEDRQEIALAKAVHQHVLDELARYEAEEFAGSLDNALDSGACLIAFDGLDEVPQNSRGGVRQAVVAAVKTYKPKRAILTCRVRSYVGEAMLPGYQSHTLAPFDEDKIRDFAVAWYKAQAGLSRLDMKQAEKRAGNLAEAALAPDLQELASNPLMLTTMAIIHQEDVGLPAERVRLYSRVVDVLTRRWQKRKTGDQALSPSPELAAFLKDDNRLRSALERLAYEAHRTGRHESETANLERGQALSLLEAPEYLRSPGLADEFLDYVDQRAGLLVGRGGEPTRPTDYSFPHRTFQEYLAGCYLLGQRDLARCYYEHAGEGDYWDLAARLGAEELYYNRRGINSLLDLAYQLCPANYPQDERGQRALLWSGQMAALLGSEAIQRDKGNPQGGEVYLERLLPHLTKLLGSDRLPALERSEAGNSLARLGDPRFDPAHWFLPAEPLLGFVCIPAGSFKMGSDPAVDKSVPSNEKPQHEVYLPEVYLARYPVTVAQFSAFVQDSGYSPLDPDGLKGIANHPVVNVTWYDALKYCDWLNEKLRAAAGDFLEFAISEPDKEFWRKLARGERRVTLPSEAEWEKAARGEKGQIYPWKGGFDADKANASETRIGGTSPVGAFPGGASPYGTLDMSGNVWEWTRSLWGKDWSKPDYKYPYNPKDNREDLQAASEILRVLRGGAFFNVSGFLRCAYRYWFGPYHWYWYLGFRVVVSPFDSGL